MSSSAPIFIGSEIYRGSSYGRAHPLAIPRVPTVTDLCRALNWLPDAQFRSSPRAKPAALTQFHTPRYIAALQQAEDLQQVSDDTRQRHQIGTLSNPVFPEMYRRPATAAGGSLLATDLLRDGGIVFNPGGGTHHGMADHAAGFCYLNDPVLAIHALLRQGLTRIAYVDIDAHHCDGVEAAFQGSDHVRLISTHEARRWPFTGAQTDIAGGAAFNCPLPRNLNDDEFALVRDAVLLPAVQDWRPDAIVLQCGADAVAEDPLSRLSLSNNAHWSVVDALMGMAPRLLVLGGGGYNPWSVGRLWAGVWGVLTGAEIPDQLTAPAQGVLRRLSWTRQAGRNPPDHWLSTLRDTAREGPICDEVRILAAQQTARLRAFV